MNIASALKSEIARVARKEIRAEVAALQKASTRYRSEIAELKRRLAELERKAGRAAKVFRKAPEESNGDEMATVTRYSAKNLASLRKKLELSAADFGKLLGVSSASVYLWEQGETRPREKNMPAIARVRGMSKKEARQALEAL